MEDGPCLSTMVTVEQLVDLAIGTPEVGVVNLNVLHSLLHVIVQQVNIQRCLVEFKGFDAERMEGIIHGARPGPILKISEYMLDICCEETIKREVPEDHVSAFKKKQQARECSPPPPTPPPPPPPSPKKKCEKEEKKKENDCNPPPPNYTTGWKERSPSKEKRKEKKSCNCDEYEEKRYKEEKPEKDNKECEEKKRKKKCGSTRDVSEESKSYYAEDVLKDKKEECDERKRRKKREKKNKDKEVKRNKPCPCVELFDKKGNRTDCSDRSSTYYGTDAQGQQTVLLVEPIADRCDSWRDRSALSHESLNKLEERVVRIQEFFELLEGLQSNDNLIARTKSAAKIIGPTVPGCNTPIADMWQLFNLHKRMDASEGGIKKLATMIEDILKDTERVRAAMEALTSQFEEDCEDDEFGRMTAAQKFRYLYNNLMDVMNLMNQLLTAGTMEEIVAKIKCMPDCKVMVSILRMKKDFDLFRNMFGEDNYPLMLDKLGTFLREIDNLLAAADMILNERSLRELELNVLREEISFLKIRKADKETMEEELNTKADNVVVAKKVNIDIFDAACNDLINGLKNALERIGAQELALARAIDELCKELENKLDKAEVQALKEFINKKLKALQDKLKALAAMRKEIEAFGTKKRILRDVNCISCDKEVIMKMDNDCLNNSPPLSPHQSMKPYLTYELDAMRKGMKDQRSLPYCEELDECDQPKVPPCPNYITDEQLSRLEHLCSRYCGGSHTVTTPQQRVMRTGHFLEEYGPRALTISCLEPDKTQKKACI